LTAHSPVEGDHELKKGETNTMEKGETLTFFFGFFWFLIDL
jgi:hypothetical protein